MQQSDVCCICGPITKINLHHSTPKQKVHGKILQQTLIFKVIPLPQYRWNLTKYRDTIDNNNTSGNEKKTCSYFKELSEIYGYRPNVNTEATISSSSTSTSTASASSNSIEAQSDHDSDAENPERKKKTTLTRKRKSTGNGMIETMNKIHEENKNTQKEKNCESFLLKEQKKTTTVTRCPGISSFLQLLIC
jgi:hypothetical protein